MTDTKKKTQTDNETEKSWTWQEISEHNHRESCWIYVARDVYDVTKWLPRHPGGQELLLLFAGRDCTEAFRAYHPFSENPYAILEKFKIGKLKGPSELVRWKDDGGFYKAVRERCGEYFKKKKLDPIKREPVYEFLRLFSSIGMLWILQWLTLHVFSKWIVVPFFLRVWLILPMALCGIMIAVNVGHMASHVPTFHMPRFNSFLGWLCFDVSMGLSWQIWLHEHIVGHHQYTNIITIDPNSPESHGDDAMYRSSPNQKWYNRFYYQFIWLPLISCLLILEYRVATYRFWFKGYRKEIRVNPEFLGTKALFIFVMGKLLWAFRSYFIPIVVWKAPIWETVIIMLGTEILAGYFVGITFPANHITDKVDWPLIVKDEKTGQNKIDQEWAVMQVKTCKDYDYDNWVFTNVFGSLNNHSCHHLFPAMHHSYYGQIYPIVKQAAKEFKVDLPDVGNYYELLYDYFNNLWRLGYDPKKAL